MKKIKNDGFTLIELMIALAIVVAIGAVISMNLVGRVSTSKIKADIQSTRVLRSALDLYEIEMERPALTRTNAATDLGYLVTNDYVNGWTLNSQAGGEWAYDDYGKLHLRYAMTDSVVKAINELSDDEKSYILNLDSNVE